MCIHIFFLKIRFWVQNESFDELSKEEPFIPCKQVGEILFPFHQDSPFFHRISLWFHTLAFWFLSSGKYDWISKRSSTTEKARQFREKKKEKNSIRSTNKPIIFREKGKIKKKKKKGSNPPYSYLWYFNLLFIYCSMTRL